MSGTTFTVFGLHVAAVDLESVGVRATWESRTAQTYVSRALLGAPSSGAELFDAVFSESVGELWRAALSSIAGGRHRLDVRLDVDGAELEELPWELMHDRTAELVLAASNRTTLVRLVPSVRATPPVDLDRPLTVLALVNERHATAVSRWTTLQKSLRVPAIERVVLQRAGRVPSDAFSYLRLLRVNVLHLIEVDYDVVGRLPADHSDLRVVVLDGSHHAAVDLVSDGVPAAVSIPASLAGEAAQVFLTTFYSGLVAAQPIEVVMSQARTAANRADLGSVATPALWMSHPWTALFTEPSGVPLVLGMAGARPRVPSATPPPAHSPKPPADVEDGTPPPPSDLPSLHVQVEPPRPTASAPRGSIWGSLRESLGGLFSRDRRSPTFPSPSGGGPGPTEVRIAYPLIGARAGRHGRANVVVVDQPFEVEVGLQRYEDPTLPQTAGLRFATATPRVDLELVLTFDPTSLHTAGPTRIPLTVTDDDPYPSAKLRFTARYRPDLPPLRRLGVQFVRDGQVVAVAWRYLVVVLHRDEMARAVVPAADLDPLLDLGPLLGADIPDLVLTICASDGAATGEFVWTAFSPGVDVPDAPRISLLDKELQQFMTAMRDDAARATDSYAAYLSLVGKATKIGRAIPPGIGSVIRAVVEDPRRRDAATILLLTEELSLPWELAVLDPPLDTPWGGVSPLLGAHAAIARWPLTQHRPRPTPRSSVTVRKAAVLAADYAGVAGWNRLDHALVEARQVAALFAPPAVTVRPLLRDVVGVLRGAPPADVLHVALHGQFDAAGSQEGLVLLGTEGAVRTAQFLTPDQVENGRLDGGPFVFLNACQVASDKRVLADYAGFASTLLRIGATGVVAPLWNVDDDVAATFARDFYLATWAMGNVSVAEAVRALRARYTEAAAESHTPGITPTLIAFQVFGHPRLRLTRA